MKRKTLKSTQDLPSVGASSGCTFRAGPGKNTKRAAYRRKPAFKLNTKPSKLLFDQWLAGFIDGDGSILITKAGAVSIEVTTENNDQRPLDLIKGVIGGNVKPRSGSQSCRYRTAKAAVVLDILNRINGHIRNSDRLEQFEAVCQHWGLIGLKTSPLSNSLGYLSGLFDADGSVTISVAATQTPGPKPGEASKPIVLAYSRGHHQLSVHVDSSDRALLEKCKEFLGAGQIILKNPSADPKQRRPNVHYRWYIRTFQHVGLMLHYLKKKPAWSIKRARLKKLPAYFRLKHKKAHLADRHTKKFKAWHRFCDRWFEKDM